MKMSMRFLPALAVAITALVTGWSANAQQMRASLNIETASAIIEGCVAHAAGNSMLVSIAVFDNGANLMAFYRMDGSVLVSVQIAQRLAATAAKIPVPTRLVDQIATNTPGFAFIEGIASFKGGLPIMTAEGDHLGGVGVSGGSSDQDEDCAQAGLDFALGAE